MLRQCVSCVTTPTLAGVEQFFRNEREKLTALAARGGGAFLCG
jgi:hypothetical protein